MDKISLYRELIDFIQLDTLVELLENAIREALDE